MSLTEIPSAIGSSQSDTNSAFSLMRCFVGDVLHVLRGRAVLLAVLTAVGAALEGATLALLLPLFSILGLAESGSAAMLTKLIGALFAALGVPMTLLSIGCLLLLLILVSAAVFLAAAYYSTKLQSEYVAYWRRKLFAALTGARWPFLRQTSKADIVSAMVSESQRLDTAFYLTIMMFSSICAIALQVLIAFFVAPSVTLVILGFGLILFAATHPLIRRAVRLGDSLTRANTGLHARVDELATAMKLIKATASEAHANRLLDHNVTQIERWTFAYAFDIQMVRAIFEYLSAAAIALMLIAGPLMLGAEVATILVVVAMFVRLFPRITGLRQALQGVVVALPAYARIRDIYEQATAAWEHAPVGRSSGKGPAMLRFEGVTVRNPDGSVALDDVRLDVPAGSFTAIVGVSGAGKTTLIDCIIRLNEPTAGEVRIDDIPLTEISPAEWRDGIGYLGQDPVLFAGTVRENVAWGRDNISEEAIETALKTAGADFVFRMPGGLDARVAEGGGNLSGGECQRIALARAFCRASRLLILDEATSAIDPENEARIVEAIGRVKGRVTVLAISHRLPAVRDADQIVVMEFGRVVERGRFDDLLSQNGRFASLWNA
jgi:ATP-binding cassette subfamily C protein